MDDVNREFHLEEYRQLRGEVNALLGRIELLFRYSLFVVAAVSAWLLSNSMGMTEEFSPCIKLPKNLLILGWLISPTFVACAGLMAATTNTRISQIGSYLKTLETTYGNPALGWESFLAKQTSIVTTTTKNIWYLLLAISIATAFVGITTIYKISASCAIA